ncbi:leucine--tRNA ligase [bacterium]|nr:leucine--tRNA ligase [bacterium]
MSDRYDFKILQEKWPSRWSQSGLFKTSENRSKPKFYCLDFFPYPSGHGLSVGHLRNYVPTDVISRLKRMQGFNVLHPMGWDAFGLPAENYALKMGVHPTDTTAKNAANYRRQMDLVACSYDWDREINSTDPEYYRWTQWFFLLLHKRGLAYQAKGSQWWCPSCRTILANEQVEQGLCWRCESEVTKKDLTQWYFKITSYSERLIDDLKTVDWPENIKKMQENWIGKKIGAEVTPEHPFVEMLTHPDNKTIVEEYVADSKKKSEIDRLSAEKEKTGVPLGSFAINPFNDEKIPLYIGDYVLSSYGTGAVMAVPAHDERDFAFAKKYHLPIRQVIAAKGDEEKPFSEAFTEYGVLIESGEFSGETSECAIQKMCSWLEMKNLGKRKVNYKFRDWLISRQRYWGAPIPIIHCDFCGSVPVPEKELPVILPKVISKVDSWVKANCPNCGKSANRETDTMDGFACSSWYFLRFLDPKLKSFAFDREKASYWLPVDLYVGGAEHAVMHLLYARFWTKVMADEGLIPFNEPFARLRNQGMLLASDGQKMSKSKGNVITPDEMVEKFGPDTLRAFILFLGTFELEVAWSDDGIKGMHRFVNRVFDIVQEFPGGPNSAEGEKADELTRWIHKTVKVVTRDLESFSFNTCLARLMEFVNALSDFAKDPNIAETKLWREAIETLLRLLAPIAPFLTEELWERIGYKDSVHKETWPTWKEELLQENIAVVPVQVNGKLRDQVRIPVNFSDDDVRKECLKSERIVKYISGKTIVKFIHIPKRMVSFVVK